MHDSLSDSSEELYSLSTATNIFDFTTTDTYVTSEANFVKQSESRLLRLINLFASSIKFSFVTVFKLLFELSFFLAYGFVYSRSKAAAFIHFLDVSKDKVVSTLMWRRGLIFRPATHGGVMVLAGIAIVAGGLFTKGQIVAQDLTASESVLKVTNTPTTIVPTNRPRSEVLSYKVASGDTLSGLANKFNVSVETIKWANNLGDSDTLAPNQTLNIPPVTGVVITVKKGDTLDSVAKTYSADKQTIADFPFNYLDESFALKVGQPLYIPNGVMPLPPSAKVVVPSRALQYNFVAGSGFLSWPVPAMISQYFSWFHPALDLDSPYGTPIYAAHAGTIIDAKKQTYSFGWYCIESFGDGWTIAYAHMSAQYCYVGENVAQGQLLGLIGATGYATGPHLHFEVRQNGNPVNPLSLLR